MATLQPVQFEVGGRKYSTIPLTGFDALDLDRIVSDKWSGMHAAVAALGIDKEDKVAIGTAMARELTKALAAMSREEYRNLLELSLGSTTLIGGATEKDVRLAKADVIGEAFVGHLVDIPEVLLSVWSANKLSPFA